MCWSLLLTKLQAWRPAFLLKKRFQHRCFLLNIAKFLRTAFGTLFVHHTFPKCYVMIEFFGRIWLQNWNFSYFLYHCFVFLHNSIVRIGSPWLFCICFHTKIFSKYKLCTHYNVGSSTFLVESLKIRKNCRTLETSPVIYCEKCGYEFFEYYALLLFFFRRCLAVMAKNNPTEKKIEAWASVKTHRRGQKLSL